MLLLCMPVVIRGATVSDARTFALRGGVRRFPPTREVRTTVLPAYAVAVSHCLPLPQVSLVQAIMHDVLVDNPPE